MADAQKGDFGRLSPDAATALLSMGMAATHEEAVLWAGRAILRGCTADLAYDALQTWQAERAAEVQTIGGAV